MPKTWPTHHNPICHNARRICKLGAKWCYSTGLVCTCRNSLPPPTPKSSFFFPQISHSPLRHRRERRGVGRRLVSPVGREMGGVGDAMASTVDGNKLPELVALLLASVVELLAALLSSIVSGYARLLGGMSAAVVVLMLVVQLANDTVLDRVLFKLPKIGGINLGLICAVLLLGWWCVGCVICTFKGPFTETSNGYFSCGWPAPPAAPHRPRHHVHAPHAPCAAHVCVPPATRSPPQVLGGAGCVAGVDRGVRTGRLGRHSTAGDEGSERVVSAEALRLGTRPLRSSRPRHCRAAGVGGRAHRRVRVQRIPKRTCHRGRPHVGEHLCGRVCGPRDLPGPRAARRGRSDGGNGWLAAEASNGARGRHAPQCVPRRLRWHLPQPLPGHRYEGLLWGANAAMAPRWHADRAVTSGRPCRDVRPTVP